jgi:hypothetical protein
VPGLLPGPLSCAGFAPAKRPVLACRPMRFPKPWRCAISALVVAFSLQAMPAAAQRAEANFLFDEGRAAMARRDYAAAISKLEQSQQMDPAVGTLLNLAECYTLLGRSASAWSAYRDAASLAATTRQLERERYAARKAQELEPQLSRLVVIIKPPARVPGLTLTRNGVLLPEALWGAGIPVDPGAQHLEAKAPGYQTWKLDVDVTEAAASKQVEMSELVAEPTTPPAASPAPVAAAPVLVPAAQPAAVPGDRGTPPPGPSALPTLGWIGVAAGAVSLGAGVLFFADGRSKISDSNCPSQICVRGVGDKSLHDSGRSREKLGVGFGIAGVALAGAGVGLLLLAPPRGPSTSMRLHVRLAASGLDLRGAF